MKKRLLLAIFVVIATVLSMSITAEQHHQEGIAAGVEDMARYFPAETAFFASLRLDEAYIDEIDSLFELITEPLAPFGVPKLTLRQALTMRTLVDANEVLDWLGDYGAVGVQVFTGAPTLTHSGYAVIEVTDAAALTGFIRERFGAMMQETSTETSTIFTVQGYLIEITDNMLIISIDLNQPVSSGVALLPQADTLLENADFAAALDNLPEDQYNMLFYGDFGDMMSTFNDPLLPKNAAPFAIGLTILDNNTFVADSAQLPLERISPLPSIIKPDFLRYIPANTSAVIHATNLTALYNSSTQAFRERQIAEAEQYGFDAGPSPDEQVSAAFQMIGIDLQADILSWMVGDYALFARADIMPIARGVIQNRLDVEGNYDLGFIAEAVNPELAQSLVSKIETELLQNAPPQVTVGEEEINGVTVITVSETYPVSAGQTFTLDLVLGANDEIFFFTTRSAAENILSGGASLLDSPDYQDVQKYLLPNPTTVLFTDNEGLLISVPLNPVVILTLLGPSIGNIFDNIVANLNTTGTPPPTPTPSPTPTPTPTLDAGQIEATLQPLQYGLDKIRHASISSTYTEDGVLITRYTLTLNWR